MEELPVIDYTGVLQEISEDVAQLQNAIEVNNQLLTYATGFLLFIVVCILLKGVYKFFRIFF